MHHQTTGPNIPNTAVTYCKGLDTIVLRVVTGNGTRYRPKPAGGSASIVSEQNQYLAYQMVTPSTSFRHSCEKWAYSNFKQRSHQKLPFSMRR